MRRSREGPALPRGGRDGGRDGPARGAPRGGRHSVYDGPCPGPFRSGAPLSHADIPLAHRVHGLHDRRSPRVRGVCAAHRSRGRGSHILNQDPRAAAADVRRGRMDRDGRGDPQSPGRRALLLLLPRYGSGQLGCRVVRAAAVSGGRDHVRRQPRVDQPRSRPTAAPARRWTGADDPGPRTRKPRAHGNSGGAGRMNRRMHARAVILITALCAASACAGPGAPIGPSIPREGGGTLGGTAAGVLAFLVQPNNVAAGNPINPEVKVEVLDTLGNVLTTFSGTVRVALGSNPSGGTLSGTVSVAAASGIAFFDTLVISNAGSGYTLVASAPGFGSVVSAPFTVFGAIGDAATR